MEPLPPGMLPNFPPNYPLKWQMKVMPEIRPEQLQNLGLPTSFQHKGRNRGYGGYEYCKEYDWNARVEEANGEKDCTMYDSVSEDCEMQSRETCDISYEANGSGFGCLSHYFNAPAPAPSSKSHYYQLAPSQNNNYYCNTDETDIMKQSKKVTHKKFQGELFCQTCDVSFWSNDEMQQHFNTHVRCPYEGCKVEATLDCIDMHITNLHLLNSNSSVQINTEEYLRQRKNNFPTLQRSSLKKAMLAQLKKRGELLGFDKKYSEFAGSETAPLCKDNAKETMISSTQAALNNSCIQEETVNKNVQKDFKDVNDSRQSELTPDPNLKVPVVETTNNQQSCRLSSQVKIRRNLRFQRKRCHVKIIMPLKSGVLPFAGCEEYKNDDELEINRGNPAKDRGNFSSSNISEDEETGLTSPAVVEHLSELAKSNCIGSEKICSDEKADEIVESISVPNTISALGLLCGYGSDDDSDCNMADGHECEVASQMTAADLITAVNSTLEDSNKIYENVPVLNGISNMTPTNSCESNASNCANVVNNKYETEEKFVRSQKRKRRGKRGLKKNVMKVVSEKEIKVTVDPEGYCNASTDSDCEENFYVPEKSISENKFAARVLAKRRKLFRYKYKQSLLQKFFVNDVLRERNKLLQCAKYIVENNFFK